MIRASELMIGDWVQLNGEPIRVAGLNESCIITFGETEPNEQLFSPIPLTTEILEKNGIKPDYAGDYFEEDFFYREGVNEDWFNRLEISCDIKGIFWTINGNEYHIAPLRYVHELQHVIKLCGIAKEIYI